MPFFLLAGFLAPFLGAISTLMALDTPSVHDAYRWLCAASVSVGPILVAFWILTMNKPLAERLDTVTTAVVAPFAFTGYGLLVALLAAPAIAAYG